MFDFELARPFLLALGLGLLVGIERERAGTDSPVQDPMGSRTFTLLALLGAVAAYVENQVITAVIAVFAGAIILVGYIRTRLGPQGSGVGTTTEVAAMATFAIGYLVRFNPLLAVMLTVLMIVILALKPRIHAFAKAGISSKEMTAAITFLVIAFVVLPLLPDRFVDPWGLVNPARLWMVLVMISGISFGGYIAVRVFGPQWGLPLAGFSAGLVSSTAATLSLSQKCREAKELTGPAAAGIVLANTASAIAQILVVAVISTELLSAVIPVVGAAVAVGLVGSAFALFLAQSVTGTETFTVGNPLALRATAMFSLMLAAVLIVVSAASRIFGSAGTLIASAIGGTTDVHAVTLAVANLDVSGDITSRGAVLAIVVAFLANMVVKLSMAAWAGGRRLILVVWPPLILMMAASVAAYLFWPVG